jgi:carbamoyl-phosphate synthase large subunit
VELLNCFREDALGIGLDLRVLAVDAAPLMSAACHLADAFWQVPRCTDAGYIPRLLEICGAEKVDLLIPTIDPELLPLAGAREQFAAVGTRVVVSDGETVAMARDKLRTSAFLEQHGIPAPRSVRMSEWSVKPDALRFPVIGKRIDGSSSIGMWEAARPEDVPDLQADASLYIVQEKWTGAEYTVNVYFDGSGRCRAAVPHLRCEVRSGEVSKGVTVRHPLLADFAHRLGEALPGAWGPLCFQAIIAAGGHGVVFEINARFGGGFPLTHRAGARFSRWLLEEVAGLRSSAHNDWKEGVVMLRYDSAVFVPPGTT